MKRLPEGLLLFLVIDFLICASIVVVVLLKKG
jgi:hypothetical protein